MFELFWSLKGHGEGGVGWGPSAKIWSVIGRKVLGLHSLLTEWSIETLQGREIFSSQLCLTSCTPLALLAIFF